PRRGRADGRAVGGVLPAAGGDPDRPRLVPPARPRRERTLLCAPAEPVELPGLASADGRPLRRPPARGEPRRTRRDRRGAASALGEVRPPARSGETRLGRLRAALADAAPPPRPPRADHGVR